MNEDEEPCTLPRPRAVRAGDSGGAARFRVYIVYYYILHSYMFFDLISIAGPLHWPAYIAYI